MKNSEVIIYLCTKNTRQVIKKDKQGWKMKSSRGIIRRMTAEQLLSHLLPPLAGKSKCRVIVKKR